MAPPQGHRGESTWKSAAPQARPAYKCKGPGRLHQVGSRIQNVTRETRDVELSGMCLGEIDIVAAQYQMFLIEVRKVASVEEFDEIRAIVAYFIFNSDTWLEETRACYETSHGVMKPVFRRLHLMGRIRPDSDAACSRCGNSLPCLMELQSAIDRGRKMLAARSNLFQEIMSLPKVTSARNPDLSGFAIFLQEGEKNEMLAIMHRTSASPLHQLGYVHDITYVMAMSRDILLTQFALIAADIFRDRGVLLALKKTDGEVESRSTPTTDDIAAYFARASVPLGYSPLDVSSLSCLMAEAAKQKFPDTSHSSSPSSRAHGKKRPHLSPESSPLSCVRSTVLPSRLLRKINSVGCNCILWCCSVIRPDLTSQEAFMALAEKGGPYKYWEVADSMMDVAGILPYDGPLQPRQPYLLHLPAEQGASHGHCVVIAKDFGKSICRVDPDEHGHPSKTLVSSEFAAGGGAAEDHRSGWCR